MDVQTEPVAKKTSEFDAAMKAQGEPTSPGHPLSFDSWAARPEQIGVARRSPVQKSYVRDSIDFGALKIFLILAGLTVGMALGLRLLF